MNDQAAVSTRVWTLPNIITMARIGLIAVFAVLLITHHDGWAIATLGVAAVSDFLDGFIARRWNLATELGRILDPAADRLLTVAVVLGLGWRGIVPWWIVAALLARDIVVGVALLWAHRRGRPTPRVTWFGKAATFGLYVMLPLAYLSFERWDSVYPVAIGGIVLAGMMYWFSGLQYVMTVRRSTP